MRRAIGFLSAVAAMRSSCRLLGLVFLLGLTGSSVLTGCLQNTSGPGCRGAGEFCLSGDSCCSGNCRSQNLVDSQGSCLGGRPPRQPGFQS